MNYLNLSPGAALLVVKVSEGDIGREISFTLVEDGLEYSIPTGSTITCEILKSDGHGTSIPCTWSGSVVTLETTEQSTIRAGKATAELRIVNGADDIGTANFIMAVEPRPINADTDQTDSSYSQTGEAGDVWTLGSNGTPSWAPSGLDASSATAGQAPIADGAGGWVWGDIEAGGSAPTPVSRASNMTDTSKVYLYIGSESGYNAGHWYYYNGSEWVDGGQYAVPFTDMIPTDLPPISTDSANAIIDTALSYVDRSNFTYGHNGIFSEEVATSPEIDCSTLVQAAFMGINYDNSRYVIDDNLPEFWGYQFPLGLPSSLQSPTARKYGFLANELAFYFYAHGWLYKITDGASNVHAGDILFEEDSDQEGFLKIGHTGIAMQNDGNGIVRIIEGGHGQNRLFPIIANYACAIRAYNCGPDTPFKWGARVPIMGGHGSKDITALINNIKGLSITKTERNTFNFRITVTEKIQKGKLYNIEINSNLSDLIQAAKSAGITYTFNVAIESLNETIQTIKIYDIDYLINKSSTIISFTPLRDYDTYNILRFTLTVDLSGYTWNITNASIWHGIPLGIELGEGDVTVDSALSATSVNPVQNRVIKSALDGKASTAVATISSAGLMSATDKANLDTLYDDYLSASTALG